MSLLEKHELIVSGILLLSGAITVEWLFRKKVYFVGSFILSQVIYDGREYFVISLPPGLIFVAGGIVVLLGHFLASN